jgi:hypothetical protein
MKKIAIALLISLAATTSHAQVTQNEKAVMAYYSGFEKHDSIMVFTQFANGFTFTSPNNDDHISVDQFREKCWPTNQYVKSVNYVKWAETSNGVFLLVEIITANNKIVRNTDFYEFDAAGKIKSIEVFFGRGTSFPGNKK